MKFVKFLQLINKKVEKYDRLAHTNPFNFPRQNYTIVWVETTDKTLPDKYFY